jgi:hypothetical protein
MSEPRPIYEKPSVARQGVIFTAAQGAQVDQLIEIGAGSHDTTGLITPAEAMGQPVYCCEEMKRAAFVGLIDGNQIEYFEESHDDSESHLFALNFCPFCGTAVGRAKGSWIPVGERLPDKDGRYLVWDGAEVMTADYWPDAGIDFSAGHFTVTHWQPLPERPEP